MKAIAQTAIAAAVLSLASAAFSGDEEHHGHHLKVSQLPAAVQTTLQRDGGKVKEVEKETEDGKTYYEISLSKDGKRYMLHVADDGTILKHEPAEHD